MVPKGQCLMNPLHLSLQFQKCRGKVPVYQLPSLPHSPTAQDQSGLGQSVLTKTVAQEGKSVPFQG